MVKVNSLAQVKQRRVYSAHHSKRNSMERKKTNIEEQNQDSRKSE